MLKIRSLIGSALLGKTRLDKFYFIVNLIYIIKILSFNTVKYMNSIRFVQCQGLVIILYLSIWIDSKPIVRDSSCSIH